MTRFPLVAAFTVAIAAALPAQNYEIVHSFSNFGNGTNGLVEVANGVFFGTTEQGGEFGQGSIFRLDPTGGGEYSYTVVHTFFGEDGSYPRGLSLGPEGDLWGVTNGGGLPNGGLGVVFRMDLNGHFTRVHRFGGQPDGAHPIGPPQAGVDQAMYGTTAQGGFYDAGIAYRIDLAGNYTKIHDFAVSDGAGPRGLLFVAEEGVFYGTTGGGGATGNGTIFRMDLSGYVTSLHSFSGTDGQIPRAGLTRAGSALYGTTLQGGDNGFGTIFRRDPDGTVTRLHSFSGADGAYPEAELVQALDDSLTFYGSTSGGGASSFGTVFVADAAGAVTTLFQFDGATGIAPAAPLVLELDGSVLGTTYYGGPNSRGTVFRLDPADQWSLVAGFRVDEGYDPAAAVVEGFDGALYGVTAVGGAGEVGTLFRLEPETGVFSTIHGFTGADGANPGLGASLLPASDGNYYGTTYSGGANDQGTVFRLDTVGTLATLHDFDGADGAHPTGRLTESGGNLYGTTVDGGDADLGTAYRVGLLGDFASLHSFGGSDGGGPYGGLTDAGDGSFFGTTAGGGASSWGVVFHMTPDGTPTTVHDVAPGDGVAPLSFPVLRSGSLYVTSNGNPAILDDGSVFRVDPSGQNFQVVRHLGGHDGTSPQAGLLLASDGNLYGTALVSDVNFGAVFRIDGTDGFSVVHEFTDILAGDGPSSALIQASDGNLYGTARNGGVNYEGTVYRILLTPAVPTISGIVPGSGPATGGTALAITGAHFQPFPLVTLGSAASDTPVELDATRLFAIAPPLPPGTLADVVVTNQDQTSATLPMAWFADFLDVPHLHVFHDAVESVFRAGITAGCGPGYYCVANDVSRAQMAVFLLKARHGAGFVPPACAGVFGDVPCPAGFAADWIEELYAEGITGGCGGGNYCPSNPVTRAQMAVFLLKTLLGASYVPPVVGQIFDDVPPGSFAADWINDLYGRAITGGCSASPLLYCPSNPNTRGQMAVFLTKTFLLP